MQYITQNWLFLQLQQLSHDFMGEEFIEKPELRAIKNLFIKAKQGIEFSGKSKRRAIKLIEKYLKGKITRTDLEKRMLEKTLEAEYAKPYSEEEFKINEYVW